MASAMRVISAKELLRIRSAPHIVDNVFATDTQLVMPGKYSNFKVPRYDKFGREDPLFQPLLTTLNTEGYTTDMKITRINMIRQQADAR